MQVFPSHVPALALALAHIFALAMESHGRDIGDEDLARLTEHIAAICRDHLPEASELAASLIGHGWDVDAVEAAAAVVDPRLELLGIQTSDPTYLPALRAAAIRPPT